MYIGMSDYDAGKKAGEAAKKIIGKGKVVGLVGYATAQNAQDRIAGVKKSFKGSELELVEVLLDDIKPEVALSNAQTAMQKYPDLAGFITFYSYDGPAACQAVKQAGKTGKVKIVAFDAEPETQRCTQRRRRAGHDRPACLLLRLPVRLIMHSMSHPRQGRDHEDAGPVPLALADPGDRGHDGRLRRQDPPEHRRRRDHGRYLPAVQGLPEQIGIPSQ